MKNELLNKVGRGLHKAAFKIKKHSPEILLAGGLTGIGVGTVMACKASTKLSTILEEEKESIQQVHDYVEEHGYTEKYSETDYKKDLALMYTQSGIKVVKLYAPSVIVGAVGVACVLASNNILKKRNVALSAAAAAISSDFNKYRSRVVERFGETVDRELKNNVKLKEIERTEVNENGEEVTIKETAFIGNPSDISEFARFFDKYTEDKDGNTIVNPNWQPSNQHNLVFLKQCERWANDKLKAEGMLFLNDVYKMLGFPVTKAGHVVGWVYDNNSSEGDNFVDFGLYKDSLSYQDYVNGHDPAILLDFNVEGNVWAKM